MLVGTQIVSIDIGTDSVNVIIAEVTDNKHVRVVGVGHANSEGVRNGVINNIEGAAETLRAAIGAAEIMANVKVTSAYVSISGEHVRSVKSTGMVTVSRVAGETHTPSITKMDLDRVLSHARNRIVLSDSQVLHLLPQEYFVDSNEGTVHAPIGISGLNLEAKVHIITASSAEVQNLIRVLHLAGVRAKEFVFAPLAASYSTLTKDEKELGVALIDLGAGTTNIALFYRDSLRFTTSIKLGGHHVTLDMAKVLGLATLNAERLKKQSGGLYPPPDGTEPVSVKASGKQKLVDPYHLNQIIFARIYEILKKIVYRRIDKAGLTDQISSIVLTGGGAMLEDVTTLASETFGKTTRIASPEKLSGQTNQIDDPSWATSVGLILYGLEAQRERSTEEDEMEDTSDSQSTVGSWIERIKIWIKQNF